MTQCMQGLDPKSMMAAAVLLKAVMLGLAVVVLKYGWKSLARLLFPGMVERGFIAAEIGYGAALKAVVFVFLLQMLMGIKAPISFSYTDERVDRAAGEYQKGLSFEK